MPLAALTVAGLVALAFSVLMLLQRSLYASAMCLLVVLFQVAAVFYLLGAELLAFLQVMIYAGAVMVLIVEAIMASPPKLSGLWSETAFPNWLVWLLLAIAFGELAAFAFLPSPASAPGLPAWPSLAADFGAALFGRYALLTEAAGVLILLAGLAVVEVSRK